MNGGDDTKLESPAFLPEIHAGFIPLIDCAPLVMAHELGFDKSAGIHLRLHREVSWANIRDKLDLGVFDCAHMLAPMPLAASLGLGRTTAPVIAPMGLSLNGNAITVSRTLFDEMLAADRPSTLAGGLISARALAKVIIARRESGRELLTIGIVFPFSSHNYDLRCWLASAGIDPDEDVNLVVVPPPLIAQSLASGRLDGFSVGEPWNSVAVEEGAGVIVATKSELWPNSLEKVLGVREAWAERHPALLAGLLRALTATMAWLAERGNHANAADVLSRADLIGVDATVLLRSLSGDMDLGFGRTRAVPGVVEFDPKLAARPQHGQAVWFATQMIRWGQAPGGFDIAEIAAEIFRPDIYDAALSSSAGGPAPAEHPAHGNPSQDFAGGDFDADAPHAYLSALKARGA